MSKDKYKDDGRKTKGIYAKGGKLYIVTSCQGKKNWLGTGLDNTPENVVKAATQRERILRSQLGGAKETYTLAKVADEFLADLTTSIEGTTESGYFFRVKRIKDFFGNKRIDKIDSKEVEVFCRYLSEEKNLVADTVKATKNMLSRIYEYAMENGYAYFNPVSDANIKKYTKTDFYDECDDDLFFNTEEANLFLEITKDDELYFLYYVALVYCLRRQEVVGLKWSSINLSRKTMRIDNKVNITRKGVVRKKGAKTRKSMHTFRLSDDMVEAFQEHKKREMQHREEYGKNYIENDYVFKHPNGEPYSPRFVSERFTKIITEHPELPQRIRMKNLRNSGISILLEQNKNIKVVQEWARHEDIKTTLNIYAKVKSFETEEQILACVSETIPINRKNLVVKEN